MTFTAEELKIIAQALTDANQYAFQYSGKLQATGHDDMARAWDRKGLEYLVLRDRVIAARLEREKA